MLMWQGFSAVLILLLGHCSDTSAQDEDGRRHLSVLKGPFRPGGSMPDWNVGGSTVVTDNYIRLTPAEAAHAGSIWSKERVPYREWDIDLQFKVSGARYLGGDGFAVWVTEQSEDFGGTFGNKDEFKGLGIIFDTYDNDGQRDNPSISAISSDGSLRFNHDSDGAGQKIPNAHCNLNYRNPRTPVSVKIRYQDGMLRVSHDIHGKEELTECFKTGPLILPPQYYIGVTAHTGQVADNHDIFLLRVTDLGKVDAKSDPEAQSLVAEQQQDTAPVRSNDSDPVTAIAGGHVPNESVEEQHKWKDGDDRHLMRISDSILNWAGKSPAEKEQLGLARRQERGKIENSPTGSVVGQEKQAAASSDGSRRSGEEERRILFDGMNEQRLFRDEVSSTLAVIQAEVKAIAHEMRGTITLAHAVPQPQETVDGEAAPQGTGSLSELLSSLSDVVRHAQRTLSDDLAARSDGLRLQLEALQTEQGVLSAAVRGLGNPQVALQETRSRLGELGSHMSQVQATLGEMRRRQDIADQRQQVQQPPAAAAAGGSGGVSWLVLVLSQVPWACYLAYLRMGDGKGRNDLPLHSHRAANKSV